MTERTQARTRHGVRLLQALRALALVAATCMLFASPAATQAPPASGDAASPTTAPDPAPSADASDAPAAADSVLLLEGRVFEISRKLRCPVCVAESVADSDAQIAQEMRQLVQRELEQGKSEAQILAYFQSRYGDWILLDPPKRGLHLVVWILPIVAAIGGVFALAYQFRRWRAAAEAPVELEPGELERLRESMRSEAP